MVKNQKNRVDVITKYFYPVAAGIEQNILQTYKVLHREHGWDVTIHTSSDTYLAKGSLESEAEVEGLKIKRYKTGIMGFSPALDWESAQVVALHNCNMFFIRFFLKFLWDKIRGKKTYTTILTPHGGFNPEWSMFSPLARVIKMAYTYGPCAWLINLTIDGVRAVSEWERSVMLHHLLPSKVRTIDNGLEDEAYMDVDNLASEQVKSQAEGWGRYIIQVARVYAIKNMETTIRALSLLPKDISYVIVGPLQDSAYKLKLESLATEMGVRDRVIFAGVIRGVDKYYLIKHAVAMVHMALWESYGNVLREGMSQGVPCVVSNVYNLPLLVKDGINGFSLPTHDYALVAEKVSWILDPRNADSLAKIKTANIELGKNQSWADVAGQMLVFYLTCTQK